MFQPATLQFLKDLKKNNNKPWFDANRKIYENAKADFSTVVEKLIHGIAAFDDDFSTVTPRDCIFRINRDVRFSKDKSPYKTNMGASFTKGGKKAEGAGYYFHLEPGNSFAGGGCYMPSSSSLANIRQEIDYNFDEWEKILHHKTFKKYFPEGVKGVETLVRPPKGYDESNPAIGFLKMKGFVVMQSVSDKALQDKNSLREIIRSFESMQPMVDFLNRAIE